MILWLSQWWFSNVSINSIFEYKSFELWQLNSIFFFQYTAMTDISKVLSANYNFSKIFSSHFSLIAMEFLFLTLFKLSRIICQGLKPNPEYMSWRVLDTKFNEFRCFWLLFDYQFRMFCLFHNNFRYFLDTFSEYSSANGKKSF